MSSRRQWRPQFSPSEFRRGWVFFALYLVVFPVLMGQIQRMLSQRFEFFLQAPEFSLIYYFLLLCATVLLFWGFLRHSFDILLDWLPENLVAFAAGLVGAGALHFLAMRLPYPVENPNALLYPEQFAAAPQATVLILVVLMPLIEEVLFRGLLFGGLRRYSRPMAFAVSTLGYALFCAVPFVFQPVGADLRYLLLAVQYLPMSLALAWCYDHGGSIWSAVALHMAVNGASLFLAVG